MLLVWRGFMYDCVKYLIFLYITSKMEGKHVKHLTC